MSRRAMVLRGMLWPGRRGTSRLGTAALGAAGRGWQANRAALRGRPLYFQRSQISHSGLKRAFTGSRNNRIKRKPQIAEWSFGFPMRAAISLAHLTSRLASASRSFLYV